MDIKKDSPPVNFETRSAHRRQFGLQILLPFLLGAVILLSLGAVAASSQGDGSAIWANISLILIVSILMITGLGLIVLVAGMIFGTDWLIKNIPPVSFLAQIYLDYFGKQINRASDSIARPVVEIKSGKASWDALVKRFSKSFRKNNSGQEE